MANLHDMIPVFGELWCVERFPDIMPTSYPPGNEKQYPMVAVCIKRGNERYMLSKGDAIEAAKSLRSLADMIEHTAKS